MGQSIEELQKQIEFIKQQEKEQELQKELNGWLECKDKVFAHFIKSSGSSVFVTLTYYKDFVVHKGKVDWTGELIEIRQNVYGRHEIKHETVKLESFHRLSERWTVIKEKEVTKDLFNAIKKSCRSVTSNFINWLEQENEPKFQLDNKEYDAIRAVEKDIDYFDIPYIELSQEERWLLSNTMFLTGNCFLLTQGSVKWLNDWYQERIKWDNFCYSSCASVGERWRNSRLDKETSLMNKIENAYKIINNG